VSVRVIWGFRLLGCFKKHGSGSVDAMAKFSWPVLGSALFFDILAFGLACGALAKRSTATPQYSAPGYLTCAYTKDTATGLAASALVFLLIGQVVITAATRCFCCGKATYRPGFGRVCSVLLLIFSWLSFIIAEVFLLTGAVLNNNRTIGQLDQGVYSVDDAFCRHVKKAIFAVGVAFSFLAILSSIVYYVLQAGARSKEQQWSSYRGEADPYSEHDGPTIGMTAYN
jgi:hypothetical protein